MLPYAGRKTSLIANPMKSRSNYPIFQWERKLQVADESMCSAGRNAGTFAMPSDGDAE
jgi:hypothetical protein